MKNVYLTIIKNKHLTGLIYQMELEGDVKGIQNAGEFIEIKLPNKYLRRPFSVSRVKTNSIEILYKVLGQGTLDMTTYPSGMKIDCFIGLGNGFDVSISKMPLLIAGGIGIAPMIFLAEEFNKRGIQPTILYGGQTKYDLVEIEKLKKLGKLLLCTVDGTMGFQGNPVEFLRTNSISYDIYYACGPIRMLEALKEYDSYGYLSLEARMGCGFGACMGCSIQTISGPKRVCKEGPVFLANEVIFS